MGLINHYSMLWSGLILLAAAGYLLFRKGFQARRVLLLVLLSAALGAGWLALRPEAANTSDLAGFESQLGAGRFLLLELQSPF